MLEPRQSIPKAVSLLIILTSPGSTTEVLNSIIERVNDKKKPNSLEKKLLGQKTLAKEKFPGSDPWMVLVKSPRSEKSPGASRSVGVHLGTMRRHAPVCLAHAVHG